MSREKPSVFHERQRLQFCLLHSLNNLFQRKDAFTRERLNLIAEGLVLDDPNKEKWTPLSLLFKPHHNALTGNYDINVLIAALEGEGKRVAWQDHRSGAATIDLEDSGDKLMGLVLNVPVRRFSRTRGPPVDEKKGRARKGEEKCMNVQERKAAIVHQEPFGGVNISRFLYVASTLKIMTQRESFCSKKC